MTLQIQDRVKETSVTTGTGPLTLAGAMTGFRAFSSVCSVADTCYYGLQQVDANGVPTGAWEVGLGTYSAASTLTRTTILASSNAGAAVSLAAGTTQVWIDLPAAQIAAFAPYAQMMGVSQTITSYSTSARVFGTTYTNSTGRTIIVGVTALSSATGGGLSVLVNGTTWVNTNAGVSTGNEVTFPVPAGQTYAVNVSYGTMTQENWAEYR